LHCAKERAFAPGNAQIAPASAVVNPRRSLAAHMPRLVAVTDRVGS